MISRFTTWCRNYLGKLLTKVLVDFLIVFSVHLIFHLGERHGYI
jgi:hypothetical protein